MVGASAVLVNRRVPEVTPEVIPEVINLGDDFLANEAHRDERMARLLPLENSAKADRSMTLTCMAAEYTTKMCVQLPTR